MSSPEENRRGNGWLSPGTVLVLCFGILVPIVAALVPVARGWLRAHDFRYSVSGPVTVGQRIAFAITVTNRGRQAEKNVEIWIPAGAARELEYELTWAPPGVRVRGQGNYKVFALGDLPPEAMARISVMMVAPPGRVSIGNTEAEQLSPATAPRIVSSRGEAQWVPATRRASKMRYVYMTGFWGFVILVFTALVWAASTSRFARRLLRRD